MGVAATLPELSEWTLVGIGSSDMSQGCKPSSPCCHPRPTGEGYTGVL